MIVLDIDDLDAEGAGLGTHQGLRVAVAGALPGERVEAQIEHRSPHAPRAWARLLSIARRAPERVEPACPAFGRCGGCALQHLDYPAQLSFKRRRLVRALAEQGVDLEVEPARPSPRALGYRNRAKLVASAARGCLVLGAYRPGTHEVVDLAGCRVVEEPIDEVARELSRRLDEAAVPAWDERRRAGLLRYVLIRASAARRVLVILVVASFEHARMEGARAVARALVAERSDVAGVVAHENAEAGGALLSRAGRDEALAGRDVLPDRIGELDLEVPARAFVQINRLQAAALYHLLDERVGDARRILDGFAGVGAEALHLARGGREVVAVELDEAAAAVLEANAARAGAGDRVRAVRGDAAAAFAALAAGGARFDCAVVDPPRKGLAGALDPLLRLGPPRLVYVSCAPESLARDLRHLTDGGYRVTAPAVPLDLFPGTPHVEAIVRLDRE